MNKLIIIIDKSKWYGKGYYAVSSTLWLPGGAVKSLLVSSAGGWGTINMLIDSCDREVLFGSVNVRGVMSAAAPSMQNYIARPSWGIVSYIQ